MKQIRNKLTNAIVWLCTLSALLGPVLSAAGAFGVFPRQSFNAFMDAYFGTEQDDPILTEAISRVGAIRLDQEAEPWIRHLWAKTASTRDFRILVEVFICESDWRQFNDNGGVLVSKGNYGIAQINITAHELDISAIDTPEENIDFAVYLYERDGLRPWRSWSGHCWQPRIADIK